MILVPFYTTNVISQRLGCVTQRRVPTPEEGDARYAVGLGLFLRRCVPIARWFLNPLASLPEGVNRDTGARHDQHLGR